MASHLLTRPASGEDLEWLIELRLATMAGYLDAVGIEVSADDHRDRVLQDFDAIKIVQYDQRDIGMIKLVKKTHVWNLIQIQILPTLQRQGIASQLISQIIADAKVSSNPVTLSVLKNNPARKLYERQGFCVVKENDHSFHMEIR